MSKMQVLFLLCAALLVSVKAQAHNRYEASFGSHIELHCDTNGFSQSSIGWYYVKRSSESTLIWQYGVWGSSVTSSHYSVSYDNWSSANLTISGVTSDDMDVVYFCYDNSTLTYLKFYELVSPSKDCTEDAVFSVYNKQTGDPVLMTCELGNTVYDDYTWIQITSSQSFILYRNNSFVDPLYTTVFAMFDNGTHSFLYMYSSYTSSFACFRTSDSVFLDFSAVTQCPQVASTYLNIDEPTGPVSYLATTGTVVRFYCNITDYSISNIVWASVKSGLSLQSLWSYDNGFTNTSYATTYYNVAFDSSSVNFTLNGVNTEDLDYAYFCIDKSTDKNLVTYELVDSLSTECFHSNVFSTHFVSSYGSPFTLSCNISGLSSDDYYWTRITQNSGVLWNNGNFNDSSYSALYTVTSNSDTSYLSIFSVSGKDAYACVKTENVEYIELHKIVECTTSTPPAAITTTEYVSSEERPVVCRRRRR